MILDQTAIVKLFWETEAEIDFYFTDRSYIIMLPATATFIQ
jgi:hypothetical protein